MQNIFSLVKIIACNLLFRSKSRESLTNIAVFENTLFH